MKAEIKILLWDEKNIYKEKIVDFYDKENKRREKYRIWVDNSSFIILAFLDWKIVGCLRVLSDFFMTALITDLFVDEKFRNNWIWSSLISETIKFCKEKNIKNIDLVADPSDKWLVNFYSKLWFSDNKNLWTFMSYIYK